MLKSGICDAHIHVCGTLTVPNTGTAEVPNIRKNKIIRNFAPFTDWISEISNTRIDIAKDIHRVMSVYSLIEYGDNYSKTFGSLWEYYRDEPILNANGAIADVLVDDNNSDSFKIKKQK